MDVTPNWQRPPAGNSPAGSPLPTQGSVSGAKPIYISPELAKVAGQPVPVVTPPQSPVGAQPPQTPSPVPPISPQPRGRRWLKFVLLGLAAVFVLAVVATYVVVLEGMTPLGKQFQDAAWKRWIDSKPPEKAQYRMSYGYTDSSKYEFVPSRVLQEFLDSWTEVPLETQEELEKYIDLSKSKYDEQLSFTLENFGWDNNLGGYLDTNTPQADGSLGFHLANQGKNYGVSGEVKAMEAALYFKYTLTEDLLSLIEDKEEEFGLGSTEAIGETKDRWWYVSHDDEDYNSVVSDFTEVGDCVSGDCRVFPEELDTGKYMQTIRDNRIVYIKSFRGISWQHGTPTLHYRLGLDLAAMKRVYWPIFRDGFETGADTSDYTDEAEQFFDWWLGNMAPKKFEVYVGLTDGKIYKSELEFAAPSLAGSLALAEQDIVDGKVIQLLREMGVAEANASARDSRRMADIRQLASALEQYYNDHNGYPRGQNGVPVGLADPGSGGDGTYLPSLPQSPTPPDGGCSEWYNSYWYEPKGPPSTGPNGEITYQDYSYTFCIGSGVGGFTPGIQELSASGIKEFKGCTVPERCYNSALSQNKKELSEKEMDELVLGYVLDFLKRMPTTATFAVTVEVWDREVTKEIQKPDGARDIEQFFEKKSGARGAGSMDVATQQHLVSELSKVQADTTMLYPSQGGIDEYAVWSSDGRFVFFKNEGEWLKLDLLSVSLDAATWRGNSPLGVNNNESSVAPASQVEIDTYGLDYLASKDPREVILSDGTKIELSQDELSTGLTLTSPSGKVRHIWQSGMENCYSPVPSPNEEFFVYICELNGIFLMQL